jgi:hypothetical protein
MTSPARIAANIANSKKSTGGRTQAGKNRSRMNAVKHGMTARIVLLPGECPEEFRARVYGWFDALRPQDSVEVTMAERAVYTSLQLDRLVRARSALTCLKAETRAQDDRQRREMEVTEIGLELLRTPMGQAAVSPFAELTSDAKEGERRGKADDGDHDHPARLVLRLSSNLAGCQWLLGRWQELKEILENGLNWRAPERFRLLRLLGIHAADAFLTPDLATLLQTSEMLDPEAGSAAIELWKEVVSPAEFASVEAAYRQHASRRRVVDRDSAREYLLAIVERETAKLEERAETHKGREELEELLAQHTAAVDISREGELLRRYECASERLMLRYIDEIKTRHAEGAKSEEGMSSGRYYTSPNWGAALYPSIDSPDQNDCGDQSARCEDIDAADEGATRCTAEPTEEPADERVTTDARAVRNEPNEVIAAAAGVLRNEANGVAAATAAGVLRNEANGVAAVIPAGTRPDEGHGDAVTESRRKRKLRERNRRNGERAAEARAKRAAANR